jgi:hypothetical protein
MSATMTTVDYVTSRVAVGALCVALLAAAASATVSDGTLRLYGSCDSGCTCSASSDLTWTSTDNREYCTATTVSGARPIDPSVTTSAAFRCQAATSTCAGVGLFTNSQCDASSSNATIAVVCGQCKPTPDGYGMKINCLAGSANISVDYCNSDCSSCGSTTIVSGCVAVGSWYFKKTADAHECNTFSVVTRAGDCTASDAATVYSEQGVCQGASSADRYKIVCGGNTATTTAAPPSTATPATTSTPLASPSSSSSSSAATAMVLAAIVAVAAAMI